QARRRHRRHLLPARRRRPAEGVREQAGHQAVPRHLQAGKEVMPPRLAAAAVLFAATALAADPKEELKLLAGTWVLDEAVLADRVRGEGEDQRHAPDLQAGQEIGDDRA